MFLLFVALHRFTPHFVHTLFGKLQIFSAAWMAHSHGTNDAQKTMGIITLALFTGTKAGSFDHLPGWLDFLKTPTFVLPIWVSYLCALTMAVGTAAGGWRIIRTLGHRMVKLQPVNAGLPAPAFGTATSFAEARTFADEIGYPVLVRPSYVLGGRGMEIVYDEQTLAGYINQSHRDHTRGTRSWWTASSTTPYIEIDVDALCDGC